MVKAAGGDPKRLRTVIFNSSAEAITALLGGHIDVVASPALNTLSHLRRGAMRVIAVTAPKRLGGELATIPTARELGADVVIGAYRSVLGPKGLAPEKIAYWDTTFARMVKTREWLDFMQKNSWEDNFMPSAESATFLRARYDAFKVVLSELGLVKSVQ
jgi:putative tricarboxylic transport membrane protein